MQLIVAFIIISTIFCRVLDASALAEVISDQSAEKRLEQKAQQRKPLSDADMQAKARILARLQGKKAGVLYDGPIMTITYVSGPDLFQVEIKTTDLPLGKEEAVNWFENSGFSMDAVCNYPVMFYPSRDVSNALQNIHIVFSTLAPGCQ